MYKLNYDMTKNLYYRASFVRVKSFRIKKCKFNKTTLKEKNKGKKYIQK